MKNETTEGGGTNKMIELTPYQWEVLERALVALESIASSLETYGPYNVCRNADCINNVEKTDLCHEHRL